MKHLGSKKVSIGWVKAPGDTRKRMALPRVVDLAASMKETGGTIHDIVVRKKQRDVAAGRDRFAAHLLNEAEEIWVKLIECSNEEFKLLERHENIYRRHDPDEPARLLLDMVEKRADEIVAENPTIRREGSGRSPGGGRTAKAIAREQVAKENGLTPQALRIAELRENSKPPPTSLGDEDMEFRTIGMMMDREYLNSVSGVQKFIDGAADFLSKAKGEMSRLLSSGLPIHESRLKAARERIEELGGVLRALRPESVCPACKGIDEVKAQCSQCAATGYISKNQMASIPAVLLNEEEPVVLYKGDLVSVHEFFKEPEPKDEMEELFG